MITAPEELLPCLDLMSCPFCGGAPSVKMHALRFPRDGWEVCCTVCEYGFIRDDKESAILKWNRRAYAPLQNTRTPSKAEDEIARLTEELRRAKIDADVWETTARTAATAKLPCGHPNDCAENLEGNWSKIGCVWCSRDTLRTEKAQAEQRVQELERRLGVIHADAHYIRMDRLADYSAEVAKALENIRKHAKPDAAVSAQVEK